MSTGSCAPQGAVKQRLFYATLALLAAMVFVLAFASSGVAYANEDGQAEEAVEEQTSQGDAPSQPAAHPVEEGQASGGEPGVESSETDVFDTVAGDVLEAQPGDALEEGGAADGGEAEAGEGRLPQVESPSADALETSQTGLDEAQEADGDKPEAPEGPKEVPDGPAASHPLTAAEPQGQAPVTQADEQDNATALAETADSGAPAQSDALASQAEDIVEAVAASTPASSSASQSTSWQRLAGKNALGTMSQIIKKGFSKSETVLLASSEGWWDALAASSLAGAHNAPVLLTKAASLSSEAEDQIKRLGAKTAYVCGGTGAIAQDVDARLSQLGLTVKRLAGRTAIDTAIAIANEVGEAAGDTCIIATVGGYWDALSASPVSYSKVAPIFLTGASNVGLSGATQAAIRSMGFSKALVTGGTGAVPGNVESQLQGLGLASVTRLAGANAYETSAKVANYGIRQGMKADNMGVATARGYWDALTGAALCGAADSVIVLADDTNRSAIDAVYYARTPQVDHGYVFGGKSAVTQLTWDYLHNRAADGKVVPTAGVLDAGQLYSIYVYSNGALMLDVPDGSDKANTQLRLNTFTDNPAQKFVARDLGGGYYGFQSLASRMYLAMSGGKLVQVAKSGSNALKWAIMPATAGVCLVNRSTGQAIAYPQAAKSTALVGAKPTGGATQRFSFGVVDPVTAGVYVLYNSRGKALTVSGGNPYATQANIVVNAANGSGEQAFELVKNGDYWQIINTKSYKAVAELGTNNGDNVVQVRSSNAASQQWKAGVDSDGYLVFRNRASGKYLDVAGNGNANGTNVQIYGASGNTGQQWRLAPTQRYTLSGNDELDRFIATVVDSNNNDLRACFNWAMSAFGAVNEVDSRRPWGIQSDAVSIDYALIGKRRGVADCYVNGALFNWLARGCGYDANFRAGAVPSASSGQAAHGWTEIYRNGVTYVCDVNLGRSYTNMNWYMITYANAPIAYYL